MAHKKKTSQVRCKRCGKCCYYLNAAGDWALCPYAIKDRGGSTTCVRYHNRIGAALPHGQYCGYRKDYRYDIPGCPYNSGKPPHPYFK